MPGSSSRHRDGAAGFFCFPFLLFLLSFFISSTTINGLLLKPLDTAQGPDVALLFLHGANIHTEAYIPLCRAVQTALQEDVRLWIGAPDEAMMLSSQVESAIKDMQANMTAQGMVNVTHQFIGGHSLGGVQSQTYSAEYPEEWTGQILMAACLLRGYHNVTFPVSTLTIGGEKDGNMRMPRLAEASHVYRTRAAAGEFDEGMFPVVVVPGGNHMSFAAGPAPINVALVDLAAEISKKEGHETIAQILAAYMRGRMSMSLAGPSSSSHSSSSSLLRRRTSNSIHKDEEIMQGALKATAQLVDPFIEAMLVEGSWHFQPPCNSDRPSPHCAFYPAWPPQPEDRPPSDETYCVCGSAWVEGVAQAHIGGLEGYATYVVRDAFHDVRDTEPYHHAHLWNNCSADSLLDRTCILNITTVTQNVYGQLDELDFGFFPVSANEMKVKMKSRQAIYQQTLDPTAKLSDTDKFNFCAEINAKAFEWARQRVPPRTRERFDTLGVQPVFDPDIRHKIQIGPVWINSPLKLQERYDMEGGRWLWHVQAPTLVTDVTANLYPDSAGFHYCKLLSPARAMEWMLVDGLRRNDLQKDRDVREEEMEEEGMRMEASS